MKPLKDKVAVVTGASRGIGRGIAVVLGEHGATVYVTGRSRRGSATPDNMPGTITGSLTLMAAARHRSTCNLSKSCSRKCNRGLQPALYIRGHLS